LTSLIKRHVVSGLETACQAVDTVMYRPFMVKLTERLPVHWHCQLGAASVALDDRWGTEYWDGMEPTELCDACGLRAAWLTIGGRWDEDDLDDDDPEDEHYLADHPVNVCGWCRLDGDDPIENAEQLELALARAKAETVRWKL
jgi:hypothetical protein